MFYEAPANLQFDPTTQQELDALKATFGPLEIRAADNEQASEWSIRIQVEWLDELPVVAIGENPLAAAQRLRDLLAPACRRFS